MGIELSKLVKADKDYLIGNTILSMKKKQFKPKDVRNILKKRGFNADINDITAALNDLCKMDLATLDHKRYELKMQ